MHAKYIYLDITVFHETELCFRNGRENTVLNVSENNGIARGTLMEKNFSDSEYSRGWRGQEGRFGEVCTDFFFRNLYMERIFLSNVEILIWNIWK